MAKVKRKKTDVGALSDRESTSANLGTLNELPTLAQSIDIREMEKAKTTPFQPGIPAQRLVPMEQMKAKTTPFEAGIPAQKALSTGEGIPSQSKKVTVKKGPSEGDNIYDPRIGGYGRAMKTESGMWKETGEQAVERIRKAKVKKKR